MCYDAESGTKMALKYAKHRGDDATVAKLSRQLDLFKIDNQAFYHVSGFSHPKFMVFTNHAPFTPLAYTWGLIPPWSKNLVEAKKFWNNTLNARGETIFEKPSFKTGALHNRCLVYLDAFYEHRHINKKTYPYRIAMKDGSPMAVAGIWGEWRDKFTGETYHTFSIVTTEANALMRKIHNNPDAEGPRMPLILPKEKQDEWLIDCKNENDLTHLKSLMQPFDENLLEAHTVGKLRGKEQIGNRIEVENEVKYPELISHDNSPQLF